MLIILGVTFLSFCLTYFSPGDPAKMQLDSIGNPYTQEMLDALRHQMGLDRSFGEQYLSWLRGFLTGDMGTSLLTHKSVVDELFRYLPNTLALSAVSMAGTMLLSVTVGILCAVKADSAFDYAVRFVTYFFSSFPNFFLALIMLNIFAVKLRLFTVAATQDLRGMMLPAMMIIISMSAHYIRQIRTIVLGELNSDYVSGCRARGIPERRILFRHVLKNSLVPIVTLVGISFGGMLGGSAIVESVFTWQGIGRYALSAIRQMDFPVIQAYVVWMAVLFLAVNSAVELICSLIDPMLRRRPEEA